jgi:hypothetical protein
MSKKGTPQPATLKQVINDLFQNEKYDYDGLQHVITFSKVNLTEGQKSSIIYPLGLSPIDYYVIYQTDKFNDYGLVSFNIKLVSFVKKGEYLYGYYLDVNNQSRYSIDLLRESYDAVELSSDALFSNSRYLELYNKLGEYTLILGLSHDDIPSSSLQYSHNCKYYYEEMFSDGVHEDNPETRLTGLSNNLRHIC